MQAVPARIEGRRVRFRWDSTPPDFIPGDPFASHFINVLHLLLPEGERWFCRVYRQAEPLITDPKLLDDVRGFIKQEASHANAHTILLEHYAARGVDTKPFTQKMEWLFQSLLADAPLGLEQVAEKSPHEWLVARVALIAAIEQFTCMLGKWALDAESLDEASADAVMLDLLRWHAAEEVEHRNVAFDLFQHLSGSYSLRVASMAIVFPLLLGIWFRGAKFMLEADPNVPEAMRKGALRLVPDFERHARKTERLPSLLEFARAAGRFLVPSYHPDGEASVEQALAYLATSPGVNALRSN